MTDALKMLLRLVLAAGVVFAVLMLAAGILTALAVVIPILIVLGYVFGRPAVMRRSQERRIIIIDHEPDGPRRN